LTAKANSERGFSKPLASGSMILAAIVVALLFFGGALRRFVRESLMQRVTSAHYEILYPPGALSQDSLTDFAAQREKLFAALDKKLGDAGSNTEIRVVFDPDFSGPNAGGTGGTPYSVNGRTIRAKLNGPSLSLPAAADAEALLATAWAKPGNEKLASWTALWLVGEWHGSEIGMAAAQAEQRLGHKKLEIVLGNSGGQISSPDDQMLLGAAWISEIAELGGAGAVRKLYSAKTRQLAVAEAARVLGTTPLELDRRWQMWMYAYLAGMPAIMHQDSGMPMDMPMPGSH
jgi:hypothetical protein